MVLSLSLALSLMVGCASAFGPGAGACGEGSADGDGDGIADCLDDCPADPKKTVAGSCGCGVEEGTCDGGGFLDERDLFGAAGSEAYFELIVPPDGSDVVFSLAPGSGDPDLYVRLGDVPTMEDYDCRPGEGADREETCVFDEGGTYYVVVRGRDAYEGWTLSGTYESASAGVECPPGSLKLEPGVCGCDTLDTDSDGDGDPDCDDLCPDDGKKIDPGICGCDVADTDTDGDGAADCYDDCPDDNRKTEPGLCGCDVPDTDTDGDGTPNCLDSCPEGSLKTEPGVCGCDVLDTDTDGDRTADCIDMCPGDGNKTEPGVCGCGVSDADRDGDGTADCIDMCPDDGGKTGPGICGCGYADTDTDGDGTSDCNDICLYDPNKIEPGDCGCGLDEASCGPIYLDESPISGALDTATYYALVVPSGGSNVVITLSPGTGDADLYVSRGAPPTTTDYDCRPYLGATREEVCTFSTAGTYYIVVYGYSDYDNWSLTGTYDP